MSTHGLAAVESRLHLLVRRASEVELDPGGDPPIESQPRCDDGHYVCPGVVHCAPSEA